MFYQLPFGDYDLDLYAHPDLGVLFDYETLVIVFGNNPIPIPYIEVDGRRWVKPCEAPKLQTQHSEALRQIARFPFFEVQSDARRSQNLVSARRASRLASQIFPKFKSIENHSETRPDTACLVWCGHEQGHKVNILESGKLVGQAWIHPAAYLLYLSRQLHWSDLPKFKLSNKVLTGYEQKQKPSAIARFKRMAKKNYEEYVERPNSECFPEELMNVPVYRPIFEFECNTPGCCNPCHAYTDPPDGVPISGYDVTDILDIIRGKLK